MRIGCLVRRVGVAAALAVVTVPIVGMQSASAAPVSPEDFTCGITVFTPCNQTAHFSTIDSVGTPLQTAEPACPPQVSTDFVTMVGTGNGIEHSIVNKAGDGWFTSTFSGTATLTAYPPSSIDNSDPNNPVVIGPPDASFGPFTGKITEWFGGSFNRSNQVMHDTFHFNGTTAEGTTSFQILDVSHFNTTPNTGLGEPHTFEITHC